MLKMNRKIDEIFGLGNKPSKRGCSDESEELLAPSGKKMNDTTGLIGDKKEQIFDLSDEKTFEMDMTPKKENNKIVVY